MIALIGEKYYTKLGKPLEKQGFAVVCVPDNPNVDLRLAGHVDLSVFIYGKNAVLAEHLAEEETIVNILTNRGYTLVAAQNRQTADYPRDANLCARTVGNKIIHNRRCSDGAIRALGCDGIDVRQAYSACSICALDDSSIITADFGVATAAGKNGIDVLLITPGAIRLEGFNYGFIGGSSFICGDTVYFSGTLAHHPDFRRIADFIQSRGKTYVFLTDELIFDFGGAVII